MRYCTPYCSSAFDQHARRQRVCNDRQVRTSECGAEVSDSRARATTWTYRRLIESKAFLVRSIYVGIVRKSGFSRCFHKQFGQWVPLRNIADVKRTSSAVVFIFETRVVFGASEVREHVVIVSRVPELTPMIVVAPVSAHINHVVDTGGASENASARPKDATAIQMNLRHCAVRPIESGVLKRQVQGRDFDGGVLVGTARFKHQDIRAAGAQAIGKDTTR